MIEVRPGNSSVSALAGVRPGQGRPLAFRLLALVLLFSLLAALLSTAVQVYISYRHELADVEARFQEIEDSRLKSLAGSLWHMDVGQIRLELDGMLNLPDIKALEVREVFSSNAQPLVVSVGKRDGDDEMTRVFPIVYDDRGNRRVVGHLYVEATLEGVSRRVRDTAVNVLITQGSTIFLMSLFILYVVWRLVSRHLTDIADYLRHFDVRRPAPTLRLRRRPPSQPDELEGMVAAFNSLCVGLEGAYRDLTRTNLALETDIEDRKAAEAQVARLNRELERRVRERTAELEGANQELSTFSYSVSHDLRAPLRRLEGFARILEDDYGDGMDERGRHCLARIRSQTRDMAGMIDSFLKLSRATTGELQLEQVDLSQMVREAVQEMEARMPGHPVSVRIEADVAVKGDRRLLTSVVSNLVENAWKFTEGCQAPKVTFGLSPQKGRMVYFLEDNGVGFDMNFADRLFAPFGRLPNAEGRDGIGIGLATVHRVVSRHGGKVWAEGTPGGGATFYFTLWEGMQDELAVADHCAG